ncbi:MAG: hypothetical protein C0423_06845 [Methylibium sp.]|nr:hypothetical protein [Methylibium sp.]
MLVRMKRSASSGLTLVELLTVVAILGIVLAVAAPSLADMMNKRRVEMVAAELSSDFAYARAESGLRSKLVTLLFASDAQTSCYVVHIPGGIGFCNCLNPAGSECPSAGMANQIFLKATRVNASRGVNLVPSGGTSSITFWPPHATLGANDSASVAVIGNRGYRLEARLNSLGRVLICDPNGSMGGSYKRCPAE